MKENAMIAKHPVFRPGPAIKTMPVLIRWLDSYSLAKNLNGWCYLFGRPKHPRVLMSMTLDTLRAFVANRDLFTAIQIKQRGKP